jgi:hypothetical protein
VDIELAPMVQTQRDLYDLPRGFERFRRYLATLTGGTDDIALPIVALNPMGKEHVAATLDALLAMDAEGIAAEAVAAARPRLAAVGGAIRTGLVVADDAGGGWTNRYFTDMAHRFDNAAMLKRGWSVALCWTSETSTPDAVRENVLATLYRTAYLLRHGRPRTLGEMMAQEGRAAVFAGVHLPDGTAGDLAAMRAIINAYRDTTAYPTVFACLYGDEAARSVGYAPLGLPAWAGFTLALAEATARGVPPEAALSAD